MISTHKKGRLNKTFLLAWFLTGILCSVALVQFRLCGRINLKKFYDVGDRYIVSYQFYTRSYEGCEYGSDGCYHVVCDNVSIPFYASHENNKNWNYIYLDLRDLNGHGFTAGITEFNTAGETVSTQETKLKTGMNEIKISPDPSSGITLKIEGQTGTAFRIHSMQFRERKSYYETGKVIKMMSLSMAVYTLLGFGAYLLFLKNVPFEKIYALPEYFLLLYGKLLARLPVADSLISRRNRWCEKKVRLLRVLCFLIMIFSMLYTENYGSYNHKAYYHAFLLFNCLIIFFLTILTIEKPQKPVRFNTLILFWLLYCICACISDILVPKNQMFTGIMMLVFYGPLFFALSGMKRPVLFMQDFITAVEISYVILTLFCLFCRPIGEMLEGRYIGCTVSPYSFALYVGIVMAIFLAELDQWLLNKGSLGYLIFYLWGILSSLYFIWLTQSRDGVLAAALCCTIFSFRVFRIRKSGNYGKRTLCSAVLCVVLAVPALYIQDWCIHYLPKNLGTTLYFDNDSRMAGKPVTDIPLSFIAPAETSPVDTNLVYAKEADLHSEKRHVLKKAVSLDILSSGRISIYKEYIARMNLLGHKKDPVISGVKMRAHNAVLQTGYRYGIFSMIPYTMMLLYAVYYAFYYLKKHWWGKSCYALLPAMLSSAILVMMMLDNVERNYRYLPWITFYLLVGFLGGREET